MRPFFERDWAIYIAAQNGVPQKFLARQYGISSPRVWQIIQRMRKVEAAMERRGFEGRL